MIHIKANGRVQTMTRPFVLTFVFCNSPSGVVFKVVFERLTVYFSALFTEPSFTLYIIDEADDNDNFFLRND